MSQHGPESWRAGTAIRTLRTAESVTEGHPDKLCDQIADAVLDAYLEKDPRARVACEVAVTAGLVVLMGEITSSGDVDLEATARSTLRNAGYTHRDLGIGADDCEVLVRVHTQSPEISGAIAEREDPAAVGAGDQGIMVGFACREELPDGLPTDVELMPLPIALAHRLCQRAARVRKDSTLAYLRPDGKSQVTIEYDGRRAIRVRGIVVSLQHAPGVPIERLRNDVREHVVGPVIPASLMDGQTAVLINPGGSWSLGGPAADTGLTGRKLLVDTYGVPAHHGGGSFSGKDPTKVDRSGAYAARHAAKNLVAAGLADRLQVSVAYAIGCAEPVALTADSFGTGDDAQLNALLERHFEFRPGLLVRQLGLRQPIYHPFAAYGHFGRTDVAAPWERLDKVDDLPRR